MLLSEVRTEVEKLVEDNPAIKPSQILKYLKEEFDINVTRQALYFSLRDWGLQQKRMMSWDDYKEQIEEVLEKTPYISLRALKDATAGEKGNMRSSEKLQTFLERTGLDKKMLKPKQVAKFVRDYKKTHPKAFVSDIAKYLKEEHRVSITPATISHILNDGVKKSKRGEIEAIKDDVLGLISQNPDIRTVDIQKYVKDVHKLDISISTVIYNLKKWNKPKKRRAYNLQHTEEQKQKLRTKMH